MSIAESFTDVADFIARASGRPAAFAMAAALMGFWLLAGPVFAFSDTWQLIANTSTSLITFLMVFVIQNSQNRDTAAIQAKLDELIRATEGHASLVGVEDQSQDEIERIKTERNQSP